jgi:hypothetical protein
MSILQIELSDRECVALENFAKESGKTPQTIVKEALEEILREDPDFDWKAALMSGAGMWKDRDDLPDFEQLRKEWDRNVWSPYRKG